MIPTSHRLSVLSIRGHAHHCCFCCRSLVVVNNPSLLSPPLSVGLIVSLSSALSCTELTLVSLKMPVSFPNKR
jgi:hypothetical protein